MDVLIRIVQSAQSEYIRQAAARALGQVKDARASKALQDALDAEKKAAQPSRDLMNAISGAIDRLQHPR